MFRKRDNWWLSLVQGIIAIVLGIAILFNQQAASYVVTMLLAIYLFAVGVVDLFRSGGQGLVLARSIAGLVVGGVLLLIGLLRPAFVSPQLVYTWLAIGLIVYGGIAIAALLVGRGGRRFSWVGILVNGLLVALGILILFSRGRFNIPEIAAWILIAIGVIMSIFAFLSRNDSGEAPVTTAPSTTPPPNKTV